MRNQIQNIDSSDNTISSDKNSDNVLIEELFNYDPRFLVEVDILDKLNESNFNIQSKIVESISNKDIILLRNYFKPIMIVDKVVKEDKDITNLNNNNNNNNNNINNINNNNNNINNNDSVITFDRIVEKYRNINIIVYKQETKSGSIKLTE